MGKNWAITIGINGYRNLQRLNFAKRDAESMRDFFQQELNIQTIYHFSDDSLPIKQDHGPDLDSQPTYATLLRFLRVRFEEPFLKEGDNLWFFFGGHGKREADKDYLMPIDADPGDVERTGIPLQYVSERLRRSGADNIVLLIDACRSGSGQRDGIGFGQEKQQGVITLFSCSPQESSYEIEELQKGAFTHALLEGLHIEGEGNCATVERLYARLRQRVPQLTQQYKGVQQTPYGVVEPLTKFHLLLLPRKANLTDILTLKNDALWAEVQKDCKLAKQLWIRVLSVSPADPEAIEGIERLARVSATPSPVESGQPIKEDSSQCGISSVVAELPKIEPLVLTESLPQKTNDKSQWFKFQVVTVDAKGHESKRESKLIQGQTEELGNGIVLEMVSIPSGSFQMGSSPTEGQRDTDESPQHQVTVSAFWMGRYTVTQAQWKIVASWAKVENDLNADPSSFKEANHPVESISWDDAMEFCARLSKKLGREYRLPSEAEWEYACRGGTKTPFHFGETITPELANYDGSTTYGQGPKGEYRKQMTEVGSFKVANAYGLFDMHGNVYEWCQDHWHDSYNGAPTDGSAWVTGGDASRRVLRGGSWYLHPRSCRSANRSRGDPGLRDVSIGLRVVCVSAGT